MSERGTHGRQADRHSDLGPSSKDWQPGSAGRDEDFTPDKDFWTAAHKGDLGAGRPGEDVQSRGASGGRRGADADVQPGTHTAGKSWTSDHPAPRDLGEALDDAVEDSFPASDPPAMTQPATGWDLGIDEQRSFDRSRSSFQVRTGTPGLLWGVAALALLPVLISAAYYLRPSQRDRRRRDEWSGDHQAPRRWET